MADIYVQAAAVQEEAAKIFDKHKKIYEKQGKVPQKIVKLISDFAYDTAVDWHEDWKYLGDHLLTQHWAVQATRASSFPEWWLDLINYQTPMP
jgi:hypothetical protein